MTKIYRGTPVTHARVANSAGFNPQASGTIKTFYAQRQVVDDRAPAPKRSSGSSRTG
jgi:hypothetical protein